MTSYDQFLVTLEQKIAAQPERRSEIISEAFKATPCPYLHEKLEKFGFHEKDNSISIDRNKYDFNS